MNTKTMTKERALELAKGWHDLHSEAGCEEQAECHGAAERLRMDALDTRTDTGRRNRVELTGKTKPHTRRGRYFMRHADGTSRQYRCIDCGHIGWSSHKDLIGVQHNIRSQPHAEDNA